MIWFSSCYYDNEEELYPSDNSCEIEYVKYSIDIEPIINKSCAITSCHVAVGTGNGVFDSYEEVKRKVDNGSFENRVIVQQNMPPNGVLSKCELDQIQAWLNQEAPNN